MNIAVIKGDGIGPEIVTQAIRVLDAVGEKYSHRFNYEYVLAGGAAIDEYGIPLPQHTIDVCRKADSVFLGAVGGPKWDSQPKEKRPEKALLGLRSELGLYANIRPATVFSALKEECPLRADIAGAGFDMVIVRELTGGIYFGESGRKETADGIAAYDVELYSEKEIERIGRVAFEMAAKRRKRLHSIDKANVLESSRLWREVMHRLRAEYSDIEYHDMYVDNAAMQIILNPAQFDVMVTSNLFGDILSDEASMITGSIGLLPSASLADGSFGLYEPIHGSAPDIAGKGIANPLAAILSLAMMLKYSFNLHVEGGAVVKAVLMTLESGARTADLAKGGGPLSTIQMTDRVLEALR